MEILGILQLLVIPLGLLVLLVRASMNVVKVIRFFTGAQRELYLLPDSELNKELTAGVIGITIVGLHISPIMGLVSYAIGLGEAISIGVFFGMIVLFFVAIFISIMMRLIWVRPPWVNSFEQGRSQTDIAYIRQRGLLQLRKEPKQFRSIISSPDGWDLWVTTVV